MAKIKLFTGLTLIFLLGALAGALGTGFYIKEHVEEFLETGGPPTDKIMRRLTRDLGLTREQQEKIGPIIVEAHEKLSELRKKSFPEMRKIRENSFALIKKELNQDQQKKLEALKNRLKKHWSGRLKSPSPPPEERGPQKPLP